MKTYLLDLKKGDISFYFGKWKLNLDMHPTCLKQSIETAFPIRKATGVPGTCFYLSNKYVCQSRNLATNK